MFEQLQNKIPNGTFLVFAPEHVVLLALKERFNHPIVTTDYLSADVDYPKEDIQTLSFGNNQFSAIVCNHVLEHVLDDRKALSECNRVLHPGGVAIFTVPGDFRKKNTWIFDCPDDNGHYRHYGMELKDVMEQIFQRVECFDMSTTSDPAWKVRRNDFLFCVLVLSFV